MSYECIFFVFEIFCFLKVTSSNFYLNKLHALEKTCRSLSEKLRDLPVLVGAVG